MFHALLNKLWPVCVRVALCVCVCVCTRACALPTCVHMPLPVSRVLCALRKKHGHEYSAHAESRQALCSRVGGEVNVSSDRKEEETEINASGKRYRSLIPARTNQVVSRATGLEVLEVRRRNGVEGGK